MNPQAEQLHNPTTRQPLSPKPPKIFETTARQKDMTLLGQTIEIRNFLGEKVVRTARS